jgi:hypothetical protein
MRITLAALSLAAGIGLICCQAAEAVPGAAMNMAVTATSSLHQVQFREYRTRHHIVKCYRDLIIGPYRCHYYRRYR